MRTDLFDFVLPPENTDPEHIDAFKYWIGPWFPYDLDAAQLQCRARPNDQA